MSTRAFANKSLAGKSKSTPSSDTYFQVYGESPEAVALSLLVKIAEISNVNLSASDVEGQTKANSRWILANYTRCLKAVKDTSPAE